MVTDLDTLATALLSKTDDLIKGLPRLAPWRPRVGIAPHLSDAELVTLAIMQAMLGFTSEPRWLRHARAHLRHLFPYLPKQPGYNKRLRKAAELVRRVTRELAADTALWTDDVWVVDFTPVECGRSRETATRSDLAGWAQYGHCACQSLVGLSHCAPKFLLYSRGGLSNRFVSGPAGPLVRIWAAECDTRPTSARLPRSTPGIGFARVGGTTTVHLRGPAAKASTLSCPRDAE